MTLFGRLLGRQRTAKEELGKSYHFPHTSCLPCIDAYDLFCDQSANWERWQRHKSWSRHIPTPLTCIQVAAWYWPPVLMVVGIACLLGLYVEKAEPRGVPNISHRDLTAPFTLTSFALALLLVFRTNNTYDRWWEARKILGGMLGVTRDIVRLAMSVSRPDCQHLVAMVARWTIAMPYVLHHHVTEFKEVAEPLHRILLDRELEYLKRAKHRPTAVMQAISDAALALATADIKFYAISQRISTYADYVAAAERLLKQPIPRAYTRHTSRFIITYIIFLPFAFWRTCQWLTPFVSGIVAFLLIGIENIGIQIEQPFAVLPLGNFSRTIEENVLEQLQMREESESLVAEAEAEALERLAREGAEAGGGGGKPQQRRADAGNLWPTGSGPQDVPQHMSIIPEDRVHVATPTDGRTFEGAHCGDSNREVYVMEPTTGRSMVNGSSSGTAQRRASSGIPGAGDTGRPGALPRRPEQQCMPHCSAAPQKNGEARQASPTHVR